MDSAPTMPPPPSRRRANLTIDLSNLPPPLSPSNTLLFTNLVHDAVFCPENLQTLRNLINDTALVHSFAPLKSFGRIVVSFGDGDAAVAVRRLWDGKTILGQRLRVFFGQPTPVRTLHRYLALPDAGKLFFISPPPSPPHGWETRLEDAPNKMVHASDLADALEKLRLRQPDGPDSPLTPSDSSVSGGRTRSHSSTLIYHPNENGCSPDLPAVVVEDMTDESYETSPMESTRPIMAHTARPPMEPTHGRA